MNTNRIESNSDAVPHIPVMGREVLEMLAPCDGGVYVDGTFGAGGYSRMILEAADCIVIAIDRDPNVEPFVQALQDEFGERFVFLQGCFGDVLELLEQAGFKRVDGFVLDLGVSSMQLDEAERGFSFRFDGPLDMRMGAGAPQSAADLVNTAGEKELADIIYKYGEEHKSRQIARAIVLRRAEVPFETTADLADIIRSVVPKSPKDKSDPATRAFQALRIAVNDELGEVERALDAAPSLFNENGRMVVVTFHSLEDRIVKDGFKALAGKDKSVSRYAPADPVQDDTDFKILTSKAMKPKDDEVSQNPRARSAKLRALIFKGGSS